MRAITLNFSRIALLASPTVIAFASGGFFYDTVQTDTHDSFRLGFVIAAWVVVVIVSLLSTTPLPRQPAARVALLGMALLFGLTALSIEWAPLAGAAYHDAQRLLLYLAVLGLAIALLREQKTVRYVEPALALGILVVITYGLSERFFPGIVDLTQTRSAGGRLEQPLTYWNAMGALAALGLVLCARLCGDQLRSVGVRMAAACAAAPLGVGLYLTFSRGAYVALAAGIVVLIALQPSLPQLRGTTTVLLSGAAAALAASFSSAVEQLYVTGAGSPADSIAQREQEGALVFVAVVAIIIVVGAITFWLCSREQNRRSSVGELPQTKLIRTGAVVSLALIIVAFFFAATREHYSPSNPAFGANSSRLSSIESNRYAYWDVSLRTFIDHPLVGIGSGGFRTVWLQSRPVVEAAKDAHSLYIETAAELGLAGLLALALLFGATVSAATTVIKRNSVTAAGLVAALVTFAFHAGFDWDWEMPAVSLVALILGGALIGRSERD